MNQPFHSGWSPASWRRKQSSQQVDYPDPAALESATGELSKLPPLVTPWEIEKLRGLLARAAEGKAFLLQGGDCAESFDDCSAGPIQAKLKILLQMSLVLVHGTRTPVIRVGRMAGQYAKPRSESTETRGAETLPSYRGDNVNRSGFSVRERTPDPELLLRGYERAALTLNFVRSLAEGGFADLHHPENWNLDFAQDSPQHDAYRGIVESIKNSISFMSAITDVDADALGRVDFYTSHEALALEYEASQTRLSQGAYYNQSTHLPWIGMRTAALEGAHVEFCRGIRNPIGLKVGPAMTPQWLTELLRVLNPGNEPGRIVLIHRMGSKHVGEKLPGLIQTVLSQGLRVLFCVDAMHGNTETTAGGIKTRRFERILSEVEQSFAIHRDAGSHLGGIHFELTGENVTECIGGAGGLAEADLERAYRSKVDPRLNYEQALEMALCVTKHLRND